MRDGLTFDFERFVVQFLRHYICIAPEKSACTETDEGAGTPVCAQRFSNKLCIQ